MRGGPASSATKAIAACVVSKLANKHAISAPQMRAMATLTRIGAVPDAELTQLGHALRRFLPDASVPVPVRIEV